MESVKNWIVVIREITKKQQNIYGPYTKRQVDVRVRRLRKAWTKPNKNWAKIHRVEYKENYPVQIWAVQLKTLEESGNDLQ